MPAFCSYAATEKTEFHRVTIRAVPRAGIAVEDSGMGIGVFDQQSFSGRRGVEVLVGRNQS
jgi:hypothetical protein